MRLRFRGLGTLCLIALLAVISSCNNPSTLGFDEVPTGEYITDTIDIEIYSVKETRFRTDLNGMRVVQVDEFFGVPLIFPYISSNPIGQINDPDFGTISAGMYMEFFPENTAHIIALQDSGATNITIDSVFLHLNPVGFYGDTLAEVSFTIHRLLDSLRYVGDIEDAMIGAGHFYDESWPMDMGTNLAIDPLFQFSTDSLAGLLELVRIPLDNSVGELIFSGGFEGLNYSDTTLTLQEHNRNFRGIFPGLYITHAPTGESPKEESPGVLWNIQHDFLFPLGLDSVRGTRLIVYASFEEKPGGPVIDTFFTFGGVTTIDNAQRYHQYTRTNTSGLPVEAVLDGTIDLAAENLFVQAGDGITMRVRLPERSSLNLPSDGLVQIARAELLLALDTTFYQDSTLKEYFPSPNIGISGFSTGDLELYETTPGYDVENIYVGYLSRNALNNIGFDVFNVSSLMQSFVSGVNPTRDFTIVYRNKFDRSNRGIYCGPGHPDPYLRPKLIITYIKPPGLEDNP